MSGASSLEQYILLASGMRGSAVASVVRQAIADPSVHVFGELLHHRSVQSLADTPERPVLDLLHIFAYGTLHDYSSAPAGRLPPLSDPERAKLRRLSLLTVATRPAAPGPGAAAASTAVPYPVLMHELQVESTRELEDIIIDALERGLVEGTLDQEGAGRFVVGGKVAARDVREQDVPRMGEVLDGWAAEVDGVIGAIEAEIVAMSKAEEEDRLRKREMAEKTATMRTEAMNSRATDAVPAPQTEMMDFWDTPTQRTEKRRKGRHAFYGQAM